MKTLEDTLTQFPNLEINEEYKYILNLLIDKNKKKEPCFINVLGKAGCGKSTLLKIINTLLSDENIMITASTGVASALLNQDKSIKATTLHTALALKSRPFYLCDSTEYTKNINNIVDNIMNTDYLIIDESSMISASLFDMIIHTFLVIKHELPSIILFGDIFQLPPVLAKNQLDDLAKDYIKEEYNNNLYYFNSPTYKSCNFYNIELKKIYRQQNDILFTNILNGIRNKTITIPQLKLLNQRANEDIINDFLDENESVIYLCSTKNKANEINDMCKSVLTSVEHTIPSKISGNWLDTDEYKSGYFPMELKLKIGEIIMVTKNIYVGEGEHKELYCSNGTIGTFEKLTTEAIVLKDNMGKIFYVPKSKVESFQYITEKDENDKPKVKSNSVGTWENFPVVSANAITIHKSQGQTIPKGVIELEDWTAPHGIYVALSRFRSINDFILTRPLRFDDLHLSAEAMKFQDKI